MDVLFYEDLERLYDVETAVVIGSGAFADVKVIKKRDTQQKYAMKIIYKTCNENYLTFVKREKLALESLSHPNIAKLCAAFEDRLAVYFITEFMPRKSLKDWLQKYKRFKIENVRYYSAELVSAIEHMREIGFVHRDIKSENVLLTENFHSKLTDFGTVLRLKDRQGRPLEGWNNPAGTPLYIAPEVFYREPLTYSTDLWNLACVVSDMYAGKWVCQKKFFSFEKDDPYYARIDEDKFTFPQSSPDPAVVELIRALTKRNPEQRIGATNLEELKHHRFFRSVDWDELKNTTPPRIERPPDMWRLRGSQDVSPARERKTQHQAPTAVENIPARIFRLPGQPTPSATASQRQPPRSPQRHAKSPASSRASPKPSSLAAPHQQIPTRDVLTQHTVSLHKQSVPQPGLSQRLPSVPQQPPAERKGPMAQFMSIFHKPEGQPDRQRYESPEVKGKGDVHEAYSDEKPNTYFFDNAAWEKCKFPQPGEKN